MSDIEMENIRGTIYDILRLKVKYFVNFNDIRKDIADNLFTKGFTEQQIGHLINGNWHLSREILGMANAIWINLIVQEIIIPVITGDNKISSQVWVSDYGKKVLLEDEYSPVDPLNYIKRIKSIYPNLNEITLLYLEEALSSYNKKIYLSSAVMLGVSAESIMDDLCETLANSFADDIDKARFLKQYEKEQTLKRYDMIHKKLEYLKQHNTKDDCFKEMDVSWRGIGELIRESRNESGHPTGIRKDKEYVLALFLLFIRQIRKINDIMLWLNNNIAKIDY